MQKQNMFVTKVYRFHNFRNDHDVELAGDVKIINTDGDTGGQTFSAPIKIRNEVPPSVSFHPYSYAILLILQNALIIRQCIVGMKWDNNFSLFIRTLLHYLIINAF